MIVFSRCCFPCCCGPEGSLQIYIVILKEEKMENFIQISSKSFVVSANGKTVAVERNDISKNVSVEEIKSEKIPIVSFLGIFEIAGKNFVAVSTKVSSVTDFWNINKVDSFEVYQLTTGQVDNEAIALLKQGLSLSPLYYSDTEDLSLNLLLKKQKHETRSHFVWNGIAKENFEKATNTTGIVTPVIAGFITSFDATKFKFVLISRRCAYRAGTRFWIRGADEDGNVANFVETEQLVVTEKETYSFVQIRGSVPMHWTQYPDLSRNPKIRLASKEENELFLNKHFKRIYDEYGKIIAVSLTDHKGRELELTETYNELGSKAENVQYQYFDFHKECSKMRFHNTKILLDQIWEGVTAEGWTELNTEKNQNGVVRTNCVDCLDRTNVVQSSIAQRILEAQLENAGCTCEYEKMFRYAWTDNADNISIQYSGTPAMKTDFTKTGKRTTKGALNDGKNAVLRYYVNTCKDGSRQDAYDVVTQTVKAQSLQKENFLIVLIMAIMMLITALYLTITGNKEEGRKKLMEVRMKLVNSPRFRPLKPAIKNDSKKD